MGYDLIFSQALKLHEAGRFDEAERLYRQILETAPENPDVLNLLGLVAQAKGIHEEAISLFDQAVRISPQHAPYCFNLALSLAATGKYYEAIKLYEKAASLTPNVVEIWIELGKAHKAVGNHQTALTCFNQALSRDKDNISAKIEKALLSENKEKELHELEQAFPQEPAIKHQLSLNYLEKKQHNKALDYALKAYSQEPDNEEICEIIGYCYRQKGDWKKSKDYFNKALKINKKSVFSLTNLGSIFSQEGNNKQAETYFQQVFSLDNNNAEAHINYADMLYHADRMLEAIEEYHKAVLLQPDNLAISNNLGVILKDIGDYTEALGLFFKAYKQKPHDEKISINIYETLQILYQSDKETAKKIAENWKKDSPNNCYAERINQNFRGEEPTQEENNRFNQKLFNNFATDYEQVLTKINYTLPQQISQILGKVQGRIWDLGCGTGLCGQVLKNEQNQLIGIDISPEMLEKAQAKNIYEDLIVKDITEFLKNPPQKRADLIIAADVFCYFGNLEEIIRLCAPTALCFSVEKGETDTYILRESGRFQHNDNYVKKLLTQNGYSEIEVKESLLRKENNQDVKGYIFYAR